MARAVHWRTSWVGGHALSSRWDHWQLLPEVIPRAGGSVSRKIAHISEDLEGPHP